MCTVAWGNSHDRLWVCFNRDEQRSRPPAGDPQLHPGPNGPIAYARDPKGGGTWLAAAPGFAVALLNAYPEAGSAPAGQRSRGLLVLDLAECPTAAEAFNRLAREDLKAYAPFYLLLCKPDSVSGFLWDGSKLSFPRFKDCFWTTSSIESEAVVAWRRANWERTAGRLGDDPERAADLLRQTNPEQPAYGTAMNRPDARTVSQVLLILGVDGFVFTYRAREPHGPGFEAPVTLRVSS